MAGISLLTGLASGAGRLGDQSGVSIDRNAFNIPDADKYRGQAETQYNSAIQRGQYTQPKQRSFLETLEQQANGQGPSLAAEQLKSAQNRNLAQQIAAAQASRGNAGLAQREMFKNQMQGGATLAAQGAQAKIQERLAAQSMFGNQLNNMQGAADQLTQQYLQQGMNMAQAQQAAAERYQQLSVQQALGLAGINSQIRQQNVKDTMQVGQNASNETSSFMSGMMGMFSDENLKQDIKGADKEISKFMDKLSEKSYEYKRTDLQGTAPGKRYGILAQDLEKSEAGKSIVHDTPHGKMVDPSQGFGLVLAAQAQLNKRLKKIESKKG